MAELTAPSRLEMAAWIQATGRAWPWAPVEVALSAKTGIAADTRSMAPIAEEIANLFFIYI